MLRTNIISRKDSLLKRKRDEMSFVIRSCIAMSLCILYSTFQQGSCDQVKFPKGIPCPKDCSCKMAVVHCSRTGYSRIPTLPSNTTSAVFKYNNIGNVTKETFTNVEELHLIYLDISYCNVMDISPGAFRSLRHLKALNISGINGVKLAESVFTALWNTAVNEITFKYALVSELSLNNCVERLENITTLDLTGNRFRNISKPFWESCFPNINTLVFDENRIRTLSGRYLTSTVKSLSIKSNELIDLDFSCSNIIKIGVEYLDLSKNFLSNLTEFSTNGHCLPNLKFLYMDHLPLRIIQNQTFSSLPSLQKLSLDFIGRLKKFESNAFSSKSLKDLRIGSVKSFRLESDSCTLLYGCLNLTKIVTIQLKFPENNGNYIKKFLPPLGKLQALTLKFAGIGVFPDKLLDHATELTSLTLIGNYFSKWDPGLFSKLTSLKYIDFGENHITDVNEHSFPEHVWDNIIMLDLGHNPFVCSCQLYWFRHDWINNNQHKLRGYPNNYYCESPHSMKNRLVIEYNPSKAECLDPLVAMAIILIISLIVIILSGLLLFKYRWHIKYYIYRLRMRRQYRRIPEGDSYQFDAFVAYNSADRSWILTELMPFLEKQQKFRLCLHDRDFEAGRLITDNIVDNMRKSRKVILVLSNSFANNQWCQFEALMAQGRFLKEGKSTLILVMLENVTSRYLTGPLGVLLQNNAIIEWTTDAVGKELFWNKLLTSLNQSSLI